MDARWDVIVVGAGHAGCEAAVAAARMGLHTALLTVEPLGTARMSCNPAIGGIAKGHMVREVDALGGVMGVVTDRAGIQFRMLNRGRGPAVWSPRAQCDKALYSSEMSELLDMVPGLDRIAGVANHVLRDAAGGVAGLELADGRRLGCRALVLTPGTFLNGKIHIGERKLAGGRIGEHAAVALSECLAGLGLERGRLKTGTPPRLHRDSVDWDGLTPQPGDDPPQPFSHWTGALDVEQVPCFLTATNARTHAVIRDNLARSPLYSGEIEGLGPRYCPSFEDKVVKFPERESHHIFLEPEGRDVPEIYVNGMSSSMPEEVQLEFIRTIRGLERAEMIRPGYAVEYDFVPPHQLRPTLEVMGVPRLYLAGQICGTSGYEEAAAQGLVAGINAARALRGEDAFVLRRDQAYIGVLVDDLVTREHREPYRMFTSAAEHRLLLRADNADERLCETGHALGLLSDEQLECARAKVAALEDAARRLARVSVTVPGALRVQAPPPERGDSGEHDRERANDGPERGVGDRERANDKPERGDGDRQGANGGPERGERDLARGSDSSSGRVNGAQEDRAPVTMAALEVLARPWGSCELLERLGVSVGLPAAWGDCLTVRVRYRGYIERQRRTAERAAGLERMALPETLWNHPLHGLSSEAREKLRRWKPATVGQASRIAGVSPSDVAVLMVHARRAREQVAS